MNYERFVQWASGPLSTLVGLGAAAVTHSTVSHATALTVASFLLGTAATAAGHIKWLTNVAKWWQHIQEQPATVAVTNDAASRAATLRAQLTAAGIKPEA